MEEGEGKGRRVTHQECGCDDPGDLRARRDECGEVGVVVHGLEVERRYETDAEIRPHVEKPQSTQGERGVGVGRAEEANPRPQARA